MDEDAISAIAENRIYAACNRKKHRDLKKFYQGVRSGYAGGKKAD